MLRTTSCIFENNIACGDKHHEEVFRAFLVYELCYIPLLKRKYRNNNPRFIGTIDIV